MPCTYTTSSVLSVFNLKLHGRLFSYSIRSEDTDCEGNWLKFLVMEFINISNFQFQWRRDASQTGYSKKRRLYL
jgi:hypothetical protein